MNVHCGASLPPNVLRDAGNFAGPRIPNFRRSRFCEHDASILGLCFGIAKKIEMRRSAVELGEEDIGLRLTRIGGWDAPE